MLKKVGEQPVAVYGSRTLGQKKWGKKKASKYLGKHQQQGWGPWLANLVLSILCFILYRVWLSDLLTAYKLLPKKILDTVELKTTGFETDHEITSLLIQRKIPILERPIHYTPRTVEEGKKITAMDGLNAIWTFLRYRFTFI